MTRMERILDILASAKESNEDVHAEEPQAIESFQTALEDALLRALADSWVGQIIPFCTKCARYLNEEDECSECSTAMAVAS